MQNDLDKDKTKINIHASSSTCKKCVYLEIKVVELNKMISKYEKGKQGLDSVLSYQRYSNDRIGLGYSKFDKPS